MPKPQEKESGASVEKKIKKKKVAKNKSAKSPEKLEKLRQAQVIGEAEAQQWGGQNKIEIEPTPVNVARIEKYAGIGLTVEQIAALFEVSKRTFELRVKEHPDLANALYKGRAIGINNVAGSVYKTATESKNEALRLKAGEFFLKTRAGWSEKNVHEVIPKRVDDTEEENKWLVEVMDTNEKKDAGNSDD